MTISESRGAGVRSYHRPYDAKEREESLKMLQRIAKILHDRRATGRLFPANRVGEEAEEERKKLFFERHNEQRNDMHFRLGWPWGELPTAKTAWEATERLLAAEPYVQTKEGNH